MDRKKRKKAGELRDEVPPPKDIEGAVREAARAIGQRLEDFPSPEELAGDDEFVRVSEWLAAADVTPERRERLARSSTAIVAAIAHRAIARSESVSQDWPAWAFRRLPQVYAGELLFLLEAIERHAEPPLVPRVLARAGKNWTWGWFMDVISAFVDRRIRAGEEPTAADLAAAVEPGSEEHFAGVVTELEGLLPVASVRSFEQWREDRKHIEFFKSFGRIVELTTSPSVLETVGGRAPVLAALEATLRQPRARSALLVGEHGVGKSAVLRDVLQRLDREGWLVFEAGAAEVNAGQSYIGQLEGRVREIAEHAAGRRVVWLFPAFEESVWAGQHSRNPHGLLDVLLPFVEAREILILGELEPRAYELVVQQRPRVTSVFETLRLEPLDRDEAIAVAAHWRDSAGADVDDATIGDAHDLAQHYLARVAAPGGLLRLLKAAHARATVENGGRVRSPVILETLSLRCASSSRAACSGNRKRSTVSSTGSR
jgi:ATP-dependent Clp protease ATP-binding subunit ClpC